MGLTLNLGMKRGNIACHKSEVLTVFLTPRWILERKQAWNPKFVICNAIFLLQIPISKFLVIFLTFCNSSWTISSQLKSKLHSMCLSESETAPATPPSLLLNSVFFYFPVSTPHSDSAFKTKPLSSLWPPQLRASTPHPQIPFCLFCPE